MFELTFGAQQALLPAKVVDAVSDLSHAEKSCHVEDVVLHLSRLAQFCKVVPSFAYQWPSFAYHFSASKYCFIHVLGLVSSMGF